MSDRVIKEALRGPWLAVLSDRSGFVFDSVEDARESVEDEEVTIAVVRGSCMPNDRNGTTGVLLRLPGSYQTGDRAYEVEAYIDDPDDASIGADARYAQARAMAAGLNAAQEAADTP